MGSFSDYETAIAGGAATAASHVGSASAQTYDISGGFSRSLLPTTLTSLRPSMAYSVSVSGSPAAAINDGGIVIAPQSSLTAQVHTNATGGASQLMWMQTLSILGSGSQPILLQLSANASGTGSDAETGVISLQLTGGGSSAQNLDAQLVAVAQAGAHAATLFGSISISSTLASGSGSSLAHLGDSGTPGLYAHASGSGSAASVSTGAVTITATGDDVYAEAYGVRAEASSGATAHTLIGGDFTESSSGNTAHTYALLQSLTDSASGSAADVHDQGILSLASTGHTSAITRLALQSSGSGTLEVDKAISADASGPSATDNVQLIAQGSANGSVHVGNLEMTVNGSSSGHAWLDIFSDHSGGISMGDLNLTLGTATSDATINVQHANSSGSGVVDDLFLAHGDSTASVTTGQASLSGSGAVHMFLNAYAFPTINQGSGISLLDLHYQLADQNFSLSTAPFQTLNGFSGAHDSVIFNGEAATSSNFINAGSFNSLGAMDTNINKDLDGTHRYVFAVYTGTADINNNGIADDHNAGVLAYDHDGNGITAVLMLPGVTTLTPADLA